LEPARGFIRIIPKVRQVALDANGGRNFPADKGGGADAYFSIIQTDDNLLWRLQQVAGYYRIIPKVNQQVALDANGGRNRPDNHGGGAAIYFSTIQNNEGNDNLLWRVQLHRPQPVPRPHPQAHPQPPSPASLPSSGPISVTFSSLSIGGQNWTIQDVRTGMTGIASC
jgi:hypothetical protein